MNLENIAAGLEDTVNRRYAGLYNCITVELPEATVGKSYQITAIDDDGRELGQEYRVTEVELQAGKARADAEIATWSEPGEADMTGQAA